MENKNDKYYMFVRSELIGLLPKLHGKVLDVGCGGGKTMRYLIDSGVPDVTGIEFSETALRMAREDHLNVIRLDLEKDPFPFDRSTFDFIIFADILEHLTDPWKMLRQAREILKDDGIMLISIPNMKNYKIMKLLLIHDRWEYADAGILDKTHLRFFTKNEAEKLVNTAGLEIIEFRFKKNRNKVMRLLHFLFGKTVLTFWAEQFLIAAKKSGTISDRCPAPV